uniref:Uncharacterized protein n=1 Tax=Lotharella globosa TaxID=91324 RepID=A0A6V3SMV1_9EUKA|mmetsp:Transcript_33024/g.64394  ORF Transcript_33024/g.64394 Transcript_33024/m.64394 type:complete len:172 (-) Transcript_33024:140-655(-)|eukprot:CAMPEP_0167786934 /NCGR_PEP_ID=MMETSP0111_2-20121227/9109_1 /TAXON_ID=91324 /ORGANISM="Lotharella globosa, Strain CCCM811" /LENGTH=171 /DNA_ID=CAMNT_0007678453 /DNA_START=25 /DNA_END=540 /DNA_ORIENTATION=+
MAAMSSSRLSSGAVFFAVLCTMLLCLALRKPTSVAGGITRRQVSRGLPLAGLCTTVTALKSRADLEFSRVSPEVRDRLKDRDDTITNSLSKIDFAEEVRKQQENLAKKGTSEYDNSCKPENPCRDPPKNAGEAMARLLSDINNAEMGMMSKEKLRRLGRDPDKFPNSVEQP